jgi:hypothetical protein
VKLFPLNDHCEPFLGLFVLPDGCLFCALVARVLSGEINKLFVIKIIFMPLKSTFEKVYDKL